MKITPQTRTFHKLVLLCVMAALLLALVAPHHADRVTTPLAMISLVPVFLFGTVIDQGQPSPMVSFPTEIPSPAPLRSALFQIPPPSLLA